MRKSCLRFFRAVLRRVIAIYPTRTLANALYHLFDAAHARSLSQLFYRVGAHLFYGGGPGVTGRWVVRFAGRDVIMPLRSAHSEMDWEAAVSIAGHEVPVKNTYREMLEARAIDQFIDVGANFGTHSLLFLAHGIPTVSFEPNAACHEYFLNACAVNGFTPHLQPVALGDIEGSIDFAYPDGQTWLGSCDPAVIEQLHGTIIRRTVPIERLDHFATEFRATPPGRTLLKIDAEGLELPILRGAGHILETLKPCILYEARDDASRAAVKALLTKFGYSFQAVSDQDFLAVPAR